MNSPEFIRRTGLTYRQMDYWVRAGHIPNPENVTYLGSGYPRDWTTAQADYTVALARLVKSGVTLTAASKAMREQAVDGIVPEVLRLGDLEIRLARELVPA